MMTKALVLDRALATLQTDAVIGRYTMEDPALGVNATVTVLTVPGGTGSPLNPIATF